MPADTDCPPAQRWDDLLFLMSTELIGLIEMHKLDDAGDKKNHIFLAPRTHTDTRARSHARHKQRRRMMAPVRKLPDPP